MSSIAEVGLNRAPERTRVSVLIPAYEMKGEGAVLLRRALDSVYSQDLGKYRSRVLVEVIVSDHSVGGMLRELCASYPSSPLFQVTYFHNVKDRGSTSANLNAAFANSTGEIVKILFQDDFFFSKTSLSQVVGAFLEQGDCTWLVSGSTHSRDGRDYFAPMVPRFHELIHLGQNTISSPSVVALKRSAWLDFDASLVWLLDVDFYKAMKSKHGAPAVIESVLVVNGIGKHQVTASGVSALTELREKMKVAAKYGPPPLFVLAAEISKLTRKRVKRLSKKIRLFRESVFAGPAPMPPLEASRDQM